MMLNGLNEFIRQVLMCAWLGQVLLALKKIGMFLFALLVLDFRPICDFCKIMWLVDWIVK